MMIIKEITTNKLHMKQMDNTIKTKEITMLIVIKTKENTQNMQSMQSMSNTTETLAIRTMETTVTMATTAVITD